MSADELRGMVGAECQMTLAGGSGLRVVGRTDPGGPASVQVVQAVVCVRGAAGGAAHTPAVRLARAHRAHT